MLDDGSSSPNGKALTSIRRKKGTSAALLVEAADGSSFFCLPSLLSRHGLQKGSIVTQALWEELNHSSARSLAYGKALELLSRREHTQKELELALIKRGFAKSIITEVLQELAEQDSVNHQRYAEVWLRSRLRKHPEGLTHFRQGLLAKGLSSHEAAEGINRLLEGNPQVEIEACEAALKQFSRITQDPDKITKKLLARGFTFSTIRQVTQFT